MQRFPAIALSVLCQMLAAPVWADIYAYTDAAGVTHLTNVPRHAGYRIVAREPRPAQPLTGGVARRERYASDVRTIAAQTQVDAALVHAVIAVESGYQADAVSARGAMGLMQLMPATAALYEVADPLEPRANIRGGARYLHDLLARFDGRLDLALAAYNAGPAAVESAGRRIPPIDETLDYVPRVMSIYQQLRAGPRTADERPPRYGETPPPT